MMKKPKTAFTHTGKLELFPMEAAWRYVSIPEAKVPNVPRRGWGSVRVTVTTGKTTWQTSIFPYQGGYFIPMKYAVCKAEGLVVGKMVTIRYEAVD